MTDALMLLTIVAFFALCVAYVRWCDRIIGPDPARTGDEGDAVDDLDEIGTDRG